MSIPYYDAIAHHAMRRPQSLAAVDLATGRRHTYKAFDDRIARLAGSFRSRFGIGPGDRIAVLAPNTTDTFEVQFACGRIGAIFVPLNWRLANAELKAILADCDPALLVHDPEFAERTQELGARQLCPLGAAFEQLALDGPRLDKPVAATLDDISTILYTSGTTGRPKGAIITHGMNFWNTVHSMSMAGIGRSTVFFGLLPLFHTGGLNVFSYPVFQVGGTVLIMRNFDAGEALQLIGDPSVGITHVFGVPANYQFMAQHRRFGETDLSRLVFAGIGGAPTPDAILRTWAAHGVILQQGYGMTETSPLVLVLDKEDAVRKAGSAGKPGLHMETRIAGEDGAEVPPGTVGELWVRGPNITRGYWNQPETTAAAFTDGWLHTGDAAMVDDEGYYFIVDRWKDMYISGGENVYPAEVENVLYQHAAIAEAAVIGIADGRWGEVGRAVVVLRPGQSLSEADVVAHCAASLARYKLPHSVVFTDALPRNATGKVHKPTLRLQFGDAAAGYDSRPQAG
ncbi:acyl-CoA synthetase [Rhodopila globiformis]|uniref:3-methylmercaptopropionyl-CoA ligase n=1 Tax=Rhodopila globiformis TaxID=1071 RepID=A0A2S6NMG2_RHOGL|nr:long-chain fatty acid--CoA ligase [Rhodopila globiformis]PPQ37199.1 acid--CoA ligase [Rhodopila globiformis]